MKQLLLITAAIFFTTNIYARRRRIPACLPCEKIHLVEDLPNDESLLEQGSYLNLGYLYEEYGIIFIPAWNKEGKYVLTNEDETTYYDVSEDELAKLKEQYNLELSPNPLSFWKKIGGKIIYLIVIGLIIYGYLGKDDDEPEEA